jgi:signal transduction histidine kinase
MKKPHTRGAIALTAAAVLIPCGVWYALGTRQLAREREQLHEAAHHETASAAERMAARLAVRLEELIDQESNRPYIHYWREYLSRGETCSALEAHRSPLIRGKRHKMIIAHFQIEEDGAIAGVEPWIDIGTLAFSDPTGEPVPTAGQKSQQLLAAVAPVSRAAPPPRPEELAQVTPMRWQTGGWRGKPVLLGVRQVITVDQTFVQGFVIDGASLAHFTFEDGFPAELLPGEPHAETDARVPILGASWHVQVDPGPRLKRAQLRAATLGGQFRGSFGGGVLGALLAGACLVVLIRRSERLAEERSRFAAAAAHELRTPLAGIRLHGEMLALSLGNPGRVNEYARRITDEAERLTRLVSNVFGYTQVEQKLLRIRREPGDLGQAVRDALAVVQPSIEAAGAELVVDVQPDLPAVPLDRDAVHQMVRNLIDNAEKYTRGGPDRRIEVSVRASAGAVEMAVRDHGPGVPARERRRIFKPFARHERGDRNADSGLGLGLSVVRTLAQAHEGTVEYGDAPGGGACFVVRLPIAA